jgi:tetratricopeptide (TPR) repeat protein
MNKIKITAALLFSLVLILVFTHFTQAQSSTPQETLQQYISDLQRNPDSTALREKIIKLALEMTPAPAIPEEAEKAFMKGAMFLEKAKDSTALELSISSFKQALLIAPWWPDAYYNLGIVLESAGRYDESIQNIKYYLLTNPSETDAKKAQRKIAAIEVEKELAQAEETAKKRAEEENKAKEPHFEGAWMLTSVAGHRIAYEYLSRDLEIIKNSSGSYVVQVYSIDNKAMVGPVFQLVARNMQINGNRISFTVLYPLRGEDEFWDLTLSEDGTKLIGRKEIVGGTPLTVILERWSR